MVEESRIPGLERKKVAYEKKIVELINNIKVMKYNKKEKGDIYDVKAKELIKSKKKMVSGLGKVERELKEVVKQKRKVTKKKTGKKKKKA